MARLNIETQMLSKGKNALRFQNLLIKIGDRQKAKGLLWELWELAQNSWFPNRLPIPETDWVDAGLTDVLVECGFAEKVEGGYRAKGAEEQFAWLFAKQENGRKGAEARWHKPKDEPAEEASLDVATDSGSQAIAKRQIASSLLSPSSSLLSLNSLLPSQGNALSAPSGKAKKPVGLFIGRYVEAYQRRYGVRPELNDGKIQGQISKFVQAQPLERAMNLIETYLQMDEPWFITKAHDFITFKENLQKVGLALDSGRDSSKPRGIKEILAAEKAAKGAHRAGR